MHWVIFDTSTKPDYYADLHNLLALPSGHVLRYSYRRAHLAENADELLTRGAPSETAILYYVQWNGFSRGDADPEGTKPLDELLAIPTRLAEVVRIEEKGERVFFDLRVGLYPDPDSAILRRLFEDLHSDEKVPFDKWVAVVSEETDLLQSASRNQTKAWEGIAQTLGSAPSQFEGDVFWRISESRGRGRNLTPADVSPDVSRRSESPTGGPLMSRLQISEGELLEFLIESYTASGSEHESEAGYALHVETGQELKIEGPSDVALRRYTADVVRVRGTHTLLLEDRDSYVKLTTEPRPRGWTSGPDIRIMVRVRKHRPDTFGAVGALVFGLLFEAAALGGGAWPLHFAAALCGVLFYLLYAHKLTWRK